MLPPFPRWRQPPASHVSYRSRNSCGVRRAVVVHRLRERPAGRDEPERHVAVGLGIVRDDPPLCIMRSNASDGTHRVEPVLLVDRGALEDLPLRPAGAPAGRGTAPREVMSTATPSIACRTRMTMLVSASARVAVDAHHRRQDQMLRAVPPRLHCSTKSANGPRNHDTAISPSGWKVDEQLRPPALVAIEAPRPGSARRRRLVFGVMAAVAIDS